MDSPTTKIKLAQVKKAFGVRISCINNLLSLVVYSFDDHAWLSLFCVQAGQYCNGWIAGNAVVHFTRASDSSWLCFVIEALQDCLVARTGWLIPECSGWDKGEAHCDFATEIWKDFTKQCLACRCEAKQSSSGPQTCPIPRSVSRS